MKTKTLFIVLLISSLLLLHVDNSIAGHPPRKTIVEIKDDKFYINGSPTFQGKKWQGYSLEGLLPNSRMVQGIFDDLNTETRDLWAYPDTKKWDPERNTNEFITAMSEWYSYGLVAFTINLQGGSPMGYGNKNWINSAYFEDGSLRPPYFHRLEKILDKADEIGMIPILGLFYFGQDQYLKDEKAINAATDNVICWLFQKGYRNVLIEVDNESDIKSYDHELLKPGRVHELLLRIKERNQQGIRFYVSTSFSGNTVPSQNIVSSADYLLLHGNGIKDPARIKMLVEETRTVSGYTIKPILFNEDDHYDFDKPSNNFIEATKVFASWGFFDYRRTDEGYQDGYQCPPVDWGIHSERKKAYFNLLKNMTGGFVHSNNK